jgi:hypothetical protein
MRDCVGDPENFTTPVSDREADCVQRFAGECARNIGEVRLTPAEDSIQKQRVGLERIFEFINVEFTFRS